MLNCVKILLFQYPFLGFFDCYEFLMNCMSRVKNNFQYPFLGFFDCYINAFVETSWGVAELSIPVFRVLRLLHLQLGIGD
ncbi:MAG: hypothetical protein NZ879_08490 [Archaeoglobaceae archaeon]|nr:hypothetical protein [Archaeoglobaceae archaeon]MDW8119002.1 hypothetical protein [Archaeoglobaceae archaeon]